MIGLLIVVAFGWIKSFVYPVQYSQYVYKYSEEFEIDPYLVFSIIKAESNFNTQAISKKKAKGLMQIMDDTATWIAVKNENSDFHMEQLYEPELNIKYGCWLLNNLEKQFDGNLDLILAAYNAGSGNVQKWISEANDVNPQDPLYWVKYTETKEYIKKVNMYYEMYTKLYDK